MTTHIALEEGRDLEDVMGWPAKRKVLHAQMLGAYHEERNSQMEQGDTGYDDIDMDGVGADAARDLADTVNATHEQAQAQTQSGQSSGASHPAAARHGASFDVDNETDWQFCEQCQGMFEPGEYDDHFEMDGFDCVPS